MSTFLNSRLTAGVAIVLIVCTAAMNVPAAAITAKKSPEEALKQIQYQYYFRGKYGEAISALETFLARTDLSEATAVSAREFLAASFILSGLSDKGKEQFLYLLNEDESYTGPDPKRFKAEVVEAFESTRDAYAAVKLRTAPATTGGGGAAGATAAESSKPIYKKWWFYAGIAAALVVVAAAASPKEDEGSAPPPPQGTVTVGVRLR